MEILVLAVAAAALGYAGWCHWALRREAMWNKAYREAFRGDLKDVGRKLAQCEGYDGTLQKWGADIAERGTALEKRVEELEAKDGKLEGRDRGLLEKIADLRNRLTHLERQVDADELPESPSLKQLIGRIKAEAMNRGREVHRLERLIEKTEKRVIDDLISATEKLED